MLLNSGILLSCLMLTYVFWDVGRLISIYTFITLISLNVLYGSLRKSEMSGKLRFQSKVEFSAESKTYLMLFFVIGYLIFVSLITLVHTTAHSQMRSNFVACSLEYLNKGESFRIKIRDLSRSTNPKIN